ncbi:MAG: GAF domain-containing sensor histidine kinase [Anaerolineae bacterium]|nr:GAF domain-containing sensor histidine kinase [Anaerolineae bacterium]
MASLVLSGLYLIYAVAYAVLTPTSCALTFPVALVSGLSLLGLHGGLKRGWFAGVDSRAWSAFIAAIVLANGLLHLVLSQDPLRTGHLIFLVIGAGYLLLSVPMLAVLIVTVVVSWLAVAWSRLSLPPWQATGAALISASALSLVLQVARLRALHQLQMMSYEVESRSRMYEQRAKHLEALIGIGHSVNAFLDLDALLNHVVETLQTRLGYDFVAIFLTDQTGDYLVARAGTGDAGSRLIAENYRLVVGEVGLIGWASRHREPVCVNDITRDDRYVRLGTLDATQSEMVVPMATGDVLLGLLDIQSAQRNAFSDDDRRVCYALADQVAIAIRNASRFEFERSQRTLSETLYTVGRALSQTLDVSEVLDLILTSLGQIVGYDRASVLLRRDDVLETVAARGFPPDRNPLDIRVRIKEGDVFRRIYETREPLIIPEIEQRADWEYVEDLPPARSWVGLPLINAGDQVIGMLSLVRETPAPYTASEVALGATFAGQAGVALHNARVYMELSEAYRQLASLDRAKSDFISLASHELRTPLTLVIGYGNMLLEDPLLRQNAAANNMVQGLALGAERLQEIVDRMVDIAEIESRTLQLQCLPMDLYALLKSVVSELREALTERHIELQLADLSGISAIEADRVALDKVFRHLLMNAIKYTPDGGEIKITARLVSYDLYGLPERCVKVTVTDTGIGIDPIHQQRIFDKFYQTGEVSLHSSGTIKFRGGGPGLGLAIVKGIVEAHRGRVWVESPGHDVRTCPGSQFNVVLPVQQPAVDYIAGEPKVNRLVSDDEELASDG